MESSRHPTSGSVSPTSPEPSVQWGSGVVVAMENLREESVGGAVIHNLVLELWGQHPEQSFTDCFRPVTSGDRRNCWLAREGRGGEGKRKFTVEHTVELKLLQGVWASLLP